MEDKKKATREIMEQVLGDDYLSFSLISYNIQEDSDSNSSIAVKISRSDQEEPITLEGRGVGAFDAFFVSLRQKFSEEFPSVKAIIFTELEAKSLPGSDLHHPTDALAEVSITIQNSYSDEITFTNRSRSLIRASLEGLLQAFEYFVNSERTYIRIYRAIEHYKKEGRTDLIDKYTSMLGVVVRNTSYTEVIEMLKRSS